MGKTTILKQLEKQLRKRNSTVNVAYLSADDISNSALFKTPEHLLLYLKQTHSFSRKFLYLMIDEFQTIPNAGLFLKNIFDNYKDNLQIIVSGSSSLEISKNSEFLTGRAVEFEIERISFGEFFNYTQKIESPFFPLNKWKDLTFWHETFSQKLDLALGEYLIFGGYPEIIITPDIEQKKILLNSIAGTYIEKDIIHFLKIENISAFNSLLKIAADQSGNLLNASELSSTLGISLNTVKKYLDILKGTYIIDLLRPFSTNLRVEIGKMPKIFVLDCGLRNYLLKTWSEENCFSGKSIENFAYLTLKNNFYENRLYYYRTLGGAEVDFLLETDGKSMVSIEVKYQNRVHGKPLAMKNLEERYPKKSFHNVIVTKNTLQKESKNLYFIPVSLLPFIDFTA